MLKVLLQTKELVKELMLDKFAHVIEGEIPQTYPILCKNIPELLHSSYCWLWILPNGATICMYFIDYSRVTDDGYRFALLKEMPKAIYLTNSLGLKDRVIKTMAYKRLEFDTSSNSAKASYSYGTVIEFTGYCLNPEAEIGFWECDDQMGTDPNSPQAFSQSRTNQAAEKMASINKKYHK